MKQEIDLDTVIWQRKIDTLIYAECRLENEFKTGKISIQEKRKIKKALGVLWLASWDYYPHPNPLLEQAFKLHFG